MRKRIGKACLVLGALCIFAAAGLFARNRADERRAAEASETALAALDENISARRAELAAEAPLVGEVGLDFSPARSDAAGNQAQVRALTRICGAAAVGAGGGPAGQRAISLHAVRSAGACLDVLEATGAAARCRCVMHWFSGSSDELGRALRLGCSFSVGERMLGTRRGREYAHQLPAARLLLETDLPDGAGQGVGAEGLLASLDRALTALAQVRGVDKDELAATLAANARTLADGVCTLAV